MRSSQLQSLQRPKQQTSPPGSSCQVGAFPGSPASKRVRSILALRKTASYAKSMGAHTPRTTLPSVAGTTRTELLRGVLSGKLHESPAKTVAPRSPTPRSWLAWRNLRSLSRKPTKKARNVAIAKKVRAIPTHPEVLGRVVPGKMKIVVRKLKQAMS
eukprot:CCRYP_009390-RA/>CCRYP_009390-RA protein AED:0.00 eAED:0.00 QI:79/1/1/1/0/0/2/4/156